MLMTGGFRLAVVRCGMVGLGRYGVERCVLEGIGTLRYDSAAVMVRWGNARHGGAG